MSPFPVPSLSQLPTRSTPSRKLLRPLTSTTPHTRPTPAKLLGPLMLPQFMLFLMFQSVMLMLLPLSAMLDMLLLDTLLLDILLLATLLLLDMPLLPSELLMLPSGNLPTKVATNTNFVT